ncbi:unnamed protein product [Phaedon cochleariae]|uniref:Peptidase C1A papain C-terminal domain-containing protein n=1 Tax=Phaedon cochleariae TaxID=80249 RepID=A0A9P0GSY0_PHACE|nr:unnamed protein product [Phaedon cochleariae]
MIAFGLLALVSLTEEFSVSVPFHPLSDEYIDHINSLQTTWKAGRNFPKDMPLSNIKRLLGALKSENKENLQTVHHVRGDDEVIPDTFDARENWPDCESIRLIRDQSKCGSCWAVAAAAAMSDRVCIFSNATDQTLVSDEDLLSCCSDCGHGCGGGRPYAAWVYWQQRGIVTGGPYNSTTGCKAYSMPPCEHGGTPGSLPQCPSKGYNTPGCVRSCDKGSTLSYKESKTYAAQAYYVGVNDEQIQLEILKNGPVEASFDVYSDFLTYKSGIYQRTSDDSIGGHAVKLIGWGEENNVPYWLITNSWNEDWGDKGIFKILRGTNECHIEEDIVAGLPQLH